MKICILYDSYEQSDSPLKEVDPPGDPRPYLEGHDCDLVAIHKKTAVKQIVALSKLGYEMFVNLCDGAWDEDRPGIEVIQALERLNLPFTGASSDFYEPTREQMKVVCQYAGIRTPAFVMAEREADAEVALQTLRFPMLVKHPNSYSSIGMTKESRVTTPEALRTQVARMVGTYGAALIEEFIEGKEFTVLVSEDLDEPAGCRAYQPVEFRFPKGETFKHFNMKWHTHHDMMGVPVTDDVLADRLRNITLSLFIGLGGS
jgi:D-alanine-D-alanine ligase-like ATP-grasp enzyme